MRSLEELRQDVVDELVTLTGAVRSWSELKEAEHAARAAAGVTEVEDWARVSSMATILL